MRDSLRCDYETGNDAWHAVAIVGFGTKQMSGGRHQRYWIVKNSWGANFGHLGGYVHVAMGQNTCHIEDGMFGVLGAH